MRFSDNVCRYQLLRLIKRWSKCWDCSDMFVLVFTSFRPSFGRPLASARDRTHHGFLSPSYSPIKKTPFGAFSMVGMKGICCHYFLITFCNDDCFSFFTFCYAILPRILRHVKKNILNEEKNSNVKTGFTLI